MLKMIAKIHFFKTFVYLLVFLPFISISHSSERTNLTGSFEQGGMIIGKTDVGANITFANHKITPDDNGYFVFGFHRVEEPHGNLQIVYQDGTSETIKMTIKKRTYKIQKIDGLPAKKVTPPESVLSRIRADNAAIAKARAHITPNSWYLEPFIWPSKGPISGVYGSQRILNGIPKQPHYGVDVAAPTGTPVVAPASGIIRLAHGDMFYSGGTLFLDHGAGLMSAFLHLDKIHVKEGQFVKQGELIADIGATGRVTGAHLDWRMNWFEKRLDPTFLVPKMIP